MKKCAIAIMTLAALSAAAAARADVTIGFSGAMSGPQAGLGQDQYHGFMLAIEQLGGKLGGQKVTVVREDDQLKPEVGMQIVQRFIEQDKVDAIVGLGFSNVLMATLPRIVNSGVVAIATNSGPAAVAGERCAPNLFSVLGQNDSFSEAMGQYVRDQGYKNVGILAPNYQAGKDKLAGFKRYYKDPVGSETYTPLAQLDFSAELTTIQSNKADAVFAFYPGGLGVNFVRQMTQSGLKMPFFSDSVIDANSLNALQDVAVGAIYGSHWAPVLDNPQNRKFVQGYEAKYKRKPTEFAAVAYDAAYLLDAAIAKLDGDVSDRKAFATAVKEAGSTFPSVRGKFAFNNNNMPIVDYYAFQVIKEGDEVGYKQLAVVLQDHKDSYASNCPLK